MKRKFNVAYMIAKENLPFTKVKAVCELERHGTELGQGYKNNHARAIFIEFIAREQQKQLMAARPSRSKFFSLQAAWSSFGVLEVPLLYVQWLEAIEDCLLNRLKTQTPELQLLTHAVTPPSTHDWERSENLSFGYAALDAICQWFPVSLEKATVDSSLA